MMSAKVEPGGGGKSSYERYQVSEILAFLSLYLLLWPEDTLKRSKHRVYVGWWVR